MVVPIGTICWVSIPGRQRKRYPVHIFSVAARTVHRSCEGLVSEDNSFTSPGSTGSIWRSQPEMCSQFGICCTIICGISSQREIQYYAEGERKKHMDSLFGTSNTDTVRSSRIIYTPSVFARSSLLHLQETGTLQALHPHKSERSGLHSCLFFTVLSGTGRLVYEGGAHELQAGDCAFIDCRKPYSMKLECRTAEAGRQKAARRQKAHRQLNAAALPTAASPPPPASGPCSGVIFTART